MPFIYRCLLDWNEDRCRGSSAGNPSPLTRYGQNGWYPPAGSHDASGGAGRGADTQS